MPSDLQKQQARVRQANKRARDKGLPEPYPKVSPEEIENRLSQHEKDLVWATGQDAVSRFKSEARSCLDLLAIYEGSNILDKESEDEEESEEEKKKSKPSRKRAERPNPSQTKITIRAIEFNGVLLEPNCDFEFRKLTEVDEVISFRRWLDLRDKARKDLIWLGRLLGKGLYHSVHRHVCNQFVQKNFGGIGLDGIEAKPMYFDGFNLDDFHDMLFAQKRTVSDTDPTPCREMVLLESRGAYKSTIDGIDSVQWLINCPDIRIMIITGVRSLAKKFAKEIKKYFYLPAKGDPTAFHLLFPEYVLTGIDGRSEQPLDCPAAFFNQKESNLWVTSIESSNTGDHCDVRKADDVVVPKNSASPELREALKFEFDGTDDLLWGGQPWGFSDVIGTRYFTDDWYGTRALPNEETKEVAPYRFSCRGAWTLKPEYLLDYKSGKLKLRDIIDRQLATLTFPAKLSWSDLRRTLNKKGERSFKNQQLNEATDAKDDSPYVNEFTEDILRQHFHPKEATPKIGEIYQAWDFSYSEKATSDFSCGVTGIIYQDVKGEFRLYILEIVFGKWKSSELVSQILMFYRRWPTAKRIYIEKANGADLLYDNIKLNAGKYNVPDIESKIVLFEIDTSANAKRNRVKSLELLLFSDRLDFVNGDWIDETIKQLVRFTGEKSTASRKDDIPDALSFFVRLLPRSVMNPDASPEEIEKEAEEMATKAAQADFYKRYFGGGGNSAPSVASAPAPEPQPDSRRAAMNRLFGGNGMRA